MPLSNSASSHRWVPLVENPWKQGGTVFSTINDFLKTRAVVSPDSVAVLAPKRSPLSYAELHRQLKYVVGHLNDLGIGRNDRVAIVLPNGPEMAVAFVSIASGTTSDFYLADLNAKALIIQRGLDSPAIQVARNRGIQLIELVPETSGPAGLFKLTGEQRPSSVTAGFAQPEDIALVLHTSGTVSRPKIVPLAQKNICASAHNIQTVLELTPLDRCLVVMPLFHIHGLIGATLSSLAAGASIVCTPGFNEFDFFQWIDDLQPTWYTAVPTMHQSALACAEVHSEIIARRPFRFIRSCSSSLPIQVMMELEKVFHAPVIESYGMTEAAHQMTSNPLPPRPRKPGSVGLAAGPEVAVMDEAGNLLSSGTPGEIVIRGPNVTAGYENNPRANESSFTNGWFRTGDQGVIDSDGYLSITGRLKEIINRGGEKIAPREVDELFLQHPAVKQAITFAVPHTRLGEDVAAAVVLRPNATASEKDLRHFALARLAHHKVPSQVLIVDEIPKGPTGKPQRIGLADKLTSKLKPSFLAPRNVAEETIAQIMAEALELRQVGLHDNFFTLGGDSLLAACVVASVESTFKVELPPSILFQAPTVEQLAEILNRKGLPAPLTSLVQLREGGPHPPIFCLPGTMGNVFNDLEALAQHLSGDQPIYGLQDGVRNPSRMKALASLYISEIQTVQTRGPYFLLGVCSGATIAFEMAQQFFAQNQPVALLALVEPSLPYFPGLYPYYDFAAYLVGRFANRGGLHLRRTSRLGLGKRKTYARLQLKVIANQWGLRRYFPRAYPGKIQLFLTGESLKIPNNPRLRWREFACAAEVHEIPGDHDTITGLNDTPIEEAHMQALAQRLKVCIDHARSKP
jgi:acyl-CoA synthetase (AMP-forming)/AMP-acid ligase II/acyl carrier protein